MLYKGLYFGLQDFWIFNADMIFSVPFSSHATAPTISFFTLVLNTMGEKGSA